MVGLTTLGLFRTAISLVAVVCGIWAFARYKKISLSNRLGQLCLASTLLTAVTALGIFQHGGAAARAGRAHARGADGRRQRGDPFGYSGVPRATFRPSVSYSGTVLFHMIPAFTESLNRLAPGEPLVASQEAPIFQGIDGVVLAAFLIGVTLQVRWLRALNERA